MNLVVTLLDNIEGGRSGSLSCAKKDQWPIPFSATYKLDYCHNLPIQLSHLLLVPYRDIPLREEQIVLNIAIVVAYWLYYISLV